jgi:hypothetical protein
MLAPLSFEGFMRDLYHASRVDPPLPPLVMRDRILTLASTGYSKYGMARHFQVSLKTFNRWLEESDLLAQAFSTGRDTLHNVLFKLAVEEKDKIAAMFLLKARHGYREGDQAEQSNKVSITFNLPGAMTPDQYKTIEAVATAKPKVNHNAD